MDLIKASRRLSELELTIDADGFSIDVLWFRVLDTGDPAWAIGRHMHSTFEFHFISKGACRVLLDDGRFDVGAGEFYLTAPGVYHEQRHNAAGHVTEYCINCDFTPAGESFGEDYHILKVLQESACRPVKDSLGAIRLFERALQEANQQKLGFYNIIRSLALMIIYIAARELSGSQQVRYNIPLKNFKEDYRYRQIRKYVEDNVSTQVSICDVARHMFLSEKQVCRIIKEREGLTTKELIMQVKLQKAKALLKDTNLPVKQIADTLGFSSEYYFSQFFKREEGYSPKLFRTNVQNVRKY